MLKALLGNSTVLILGINAYHGDVWAVLLRDGELVAAVEEERGKRYFRMRIAECGIFANAQHPEGTRIRDPEWVLIDCEVRVAT